MTKKPAMESCFFEKINKIDDPLSRLTKGMDTNKKNQKCRRRNYYKYH